MPSFDVVSEMAKHEPANAVDHASREMGNYFKVKCTNARFNHAECAVTMHAEPNPQVKQMLEADFDGVGVVAAGIVAGAVADMAQRVNQRQAPA